jgi:hypothetical protein
MKERVPETKYKLFPTNEPRTWMRADEENMGVGSFDNTWKNSGPSQQQQRGGGWQSQGRLAGGQHSGGTSRDGDVGRGMGGGQASRRENSGRGASHTGGGFGADSRQVTLEGMWGSQRSTSQNTRPTGLWANELIDGVTGENRGEGRYNSAQTNSGITFTQSSRDSDIYG